jgi:putative transposase
MLARLGRSAAGLIVHHDRDGVFTGHGWTHALVVVARGRLSYALHGARENPEMECFFGRSKTEKASLFHDAPDLAALTVVTAQRIHYYNHHRRHSALGNVPPREHLQARLRGQPPQ